MARGGPLWHVPVYPDRLHVMAHPTLRLLKRAINQPPNHRYYFNQPEFHDKYVKTLKFYPDRSTLVLPPRNSEEAVAAYKRLVEQAEQARALKASSSPAADPSSSSSTSASN